MNAPRDDGTVSDGAGPGALLRLALRLVVPFELREPFVGDLLEECHAHALAPGEARAWMWRQAAAALPAMLRYRLGRGGRVARARWAAAATLAVLGSVQLAETGALAATPWVAWASGSAVALPVLAFLLATRPIMQLAMTAAGSVLLAVVKVLSPDPLGSMLIVTVFSFALLTALLRKEQAARQAWCAAREPPDDRSPA